MNYFVFGFSVAVIVLRAALSLAKGGVYNAALI